ALELKTPVFATMPHILNEVGNKKLSKRDNAKDILDYIDSGFLPETLMNFIATLGWNDGTEQEIFSPEELIKKFSLDRVGRSGAKFDENRLLWMNGQWIRRLSLEELEKRAIDFWPKSAQSASQEQRREVLGLVQDRLKTLADLPTLTSYFFEEPKPNWSMIDKNKQLSKLEKQQITSLLTTTKDALEKSEFDPDSLQNTLNQLLETTGQKPGVLFGLIRIAVSWAPFSPALNETLSVLGKEVVIKRLGGAINLSVQQ
ncbi:MAG: glutamate--tRNA ligase, partial [Thiobacillus sp.]